MNKTNQPAQPEQVEDRRGRAGEVAKKAAAAVAGAGALAGMGGATAALANDLNGSQELVDNLADIIDDTPQEMHLAQATDGATPAHVDAAEVADVEPVERVTVPHRVRPQDARAAQRAAHEQPLAASDEPQTAVADSDTILAQNELPDDPFDPVEPSPDEPLWAFNEGARQARDADIEFGDFDDSVSTRPVELLDSEELVDPDDINSVDWLTNNEMKPVNVGHNDQGQATALLKLVDEDGYETEFTMVDTDGDGVFDVLEDAFGYRYTEYAGKLDLNVSDVQARIDNNLSVPLSPYTAFGQVEISPDDLITIQGNADSADFVYVDVHEFMDVDDMAPVVPDNDLDGHLAYVAGARDVDTDESTMVADDDHIIIEMEDDPLLAANDDNEETDTDFV